MKKNILFIAWIAIFSLTASNSQAQSLKDLLNKDNISKVVNAITGTPETIDMTGTWTYSGSAVEFESDNLLMKAGGAAAATMAENKLNEQLTKVGIKEGQMSFTFNADSTFTSTVGKKKLSGTYSYNASTKQVDLKYLKLLNLPRESELHLQLYGPAVQLRQTTQINDIPRQQDKQHRTENSKLTC